MVDNKKNYHSLIASAILGKRATIVKGEIKRKEIERLIYLL